MSTPEQNDPKIWLIWSNEHSAFWRPDSAGYTAYIDSAGRYTEAQANTRCAMRDRREGHPPPEIKFPAPEAVATLTAENEKLRRHLTTMIAYARYEVKELPFHHPTLPSAIAEATAALTPQEGQT